MLGMDHGQRSNAVGSLPSYLPDGDPGRQGGNTYTGGNSTEPTIQDYENIFGPSARDIKTDLQRFKRHGRWHLPDVLKGPNPWLTDRIDGLITDATNSPFTTKLLPYMYKEDVDGKMKWNVWSFDEGMASRVPYESAARTLTQSKRSFSGYMVRQGMAIVLEHNFMMSPKGRENFKNQLNQLIGSIQYTNDLDVHMALILAPSHAKTMRERYYSLDKSPSQICREYVDLFGMMQKNVNALDILIEEGKAILRTWGGPMPDFLLCNSKLTFQMTMTPEKTNYITQGVDGIKRLKQGPDLGSYRGLSIIHSRSFSMETGQAPRDILRRRVRTAEYYRVPPSKKNVNREFEFYNEERDTWFTLSFMDLLRYALHETHGNGDAGRDNASLLHRIYQQLLNGPPAPVSIAGHLDSGFTLDARRRTALTLTPEESLLMIAVEEAMTRADACPLLTFYGDNLSFAPIENGRFNWTLRLRSFDMGVHHQTPKHSLLWDLWTIEVSSRAGALGLNLGRALNGMIAVPRFTKQMARDFYESMRFITLNDPFNKGGKALPGTPAWFAAFAFYVEIYKRGGLPMDLVQDFNPAGLPPPLNANAFNTLNRFTTTLAGIPIRPERPAENIIDITAQFLGITGAVGSVNHHMHLAPIAVCGCSPSGPEIEAELGNRGSFLGRRVLMTYELLGPLLREYNIDGKAVAGIEYLAHGSLEITQSITRVLRELFARAIPASTPVEVTTRLGSRLIYLVKELLQPLAAYDKSIPDSVYLAMAGVNTWSMGMTTLSHPGHPYNQDDAEVTFFKARKDLLQLSSGHLNLSFVRQIHDNPFPPNQHSHPLFSRKVCVNVVTDVPTDAEYRQELDMLIKAFHTRLTKDPILDNTLFSLIKLGGVGAMLPIGQAYMGTLPNARSELRYLDNLGTRLDARIPGDVVSAIADAGLGAVSIDLDRLFLAEPETPGPPARPGASSAAGRVEDVEIIVVRPNIEHNMLGVIMGLGGSELGHTLWGQTELSVYDDSMHGIWGMSYKYHERAIVFNEKNLIRLWDIAYDGYNGGKDDTYVDWTKPNGPNGVETFKQETMDVSKNYRGPSMMVMAFVHDREAKDDDGRPVYDTHFKRNWPSPIVFHDSYSPGSAPAPEKATLPLDYDNLQVVDVEQFRVFNNPLYYESYSQYRGMMPAFHEMHMMRKSAGQSSADSETHTDSLAFQGSMRVKEAGRGAVEEIQGSGHHGPDYTGVASVRAGKGQKVAVQAPIPHRLI
jgi:hypothetical protein